MRACSYLAKRKSCSFNTLKSDMRQKYYTDYLHTAKIDKVK